MSKKNLAGVHEAGCPLQIRQVFIPAADVKTLGSIPFVVVPNPGSGGHSTNYATAHSAGEVGPERAILFERAIVNVVGGTTGGTGDYDTADCDLVFFYATSGYAAGQVSCAFDNAITGKDVGTVFAIERLGAETAIQTTGMVLPNEGLALGGVDAAGAAAEPYTAAGDHNLLVTVMYRIIDVKGY